jgi:hypothetical protein
MYPVYRKAVKTDKVVKDVYPKDIMGRKETLIYATLPTLMTEEKWKEIKKEVDKAFKTEKVPK